MYKVVTELAYVGHINSRVDNQTFFYDNQLNATNSFNFLSEKQKQIIETNKQRGKVLAGSVKLYDMDDNENVLNQVLNLD